MSTTRIMTGVADFSGGRIHSLRIGEMTARHPQPRYATTCERCGARGTVSQRDIAIGKARCQAAGCGKEKLRDYLNDTPRKAAEREAQRMRDVVSTAGAQLKQTYLQLNAVVRERLLGKVRDSDRVPVDPSVAGVKMTLEEASRFNRAEFAKYRQGHPDLYWNDELLENLGHYFDANGLKIVTVNMLAALMDRYRDAGLLPDPPQPEPELQPIPEPEPTVTFEPELENGWDGDGNPIMLTKRKVDKLSSLEYRRFKHLDRAALEGTIPRFGPGPLRIV